jgi:Domain of unknown function (DUF4405)
MKISREWATPLTIGAFGFMSVTGVLMFFHLDRGLNKLAHEWLGWIFVVGVAAHAIVNWKSFTRYFLANGIGRAIIGLSAIVLAGSFVSLPSSGGEGPPPVLAMRAVTKAPIASVAPLTGRTAEQLIDQLSKAGIALPDANASIDSVIGGKRELQSKAMMVLFRTPHD